MSKFTPSESRIQIRAPDDVVEHILDPNLGSKLRAAMKGTMDIPPALEKIINQGSKAQRVIFLLQMVLGYLDDDRSGNGNEPGKAEVAATATTEKPKTTPEATVTGRPAVSAGDLKKLE